MIDMKHDYNSLTKTLYSGIDLSLKDRIEKGAKGSKKGQIVYESIMHFPSILCGMLETLRDILITILFQWNLYALQVFHYILSLLFHSCLPQKIENFGLSLNLPNYHSL